MNALDEIALGVGRVAMATAGLEQAGAALAATLLDSRLASIVIDGQNWNQISAACSALLTQALRDHESDTIVDVCEEAKQALTAANDIMTKRRSVVHGEWLEPEDIESTKMHLAKLTQRWGRVTAVGWTADELIDLEEPAWRCMVAIWRACAQFQRARAGEDINQPGDPTPRPIY